jgi:hypothetical protein
MEVPFQYFYGGTEEDRGYLSQDSRYPGRHSNRTLPRSSLEQWFPKWVVPPLGGPL